MEMTAEAEAEIDSACDRYRERLTTLAKTYTIASTETRLTRAIKKQDVWNAEMQMTRGETQ